MKPKSLKMPDSDARRHVVARLRKTWAPRPTCKPKLSEKQALVEGVSDSEPEFIWFDHHTDEKK